MSVKYNKLRHCILIVPAEEPKMKSLKNMQDH